MRRGLRVEHEVDAQPVSGVALRQGRHRSRRLHRPARRLIEQGGVRLNNEQVTDSSRSVGPSDLATATTLVLRLGKKRQFLARFV